MKQVIPINPNVERNQPAEAARRNVELLVAMLNLKLPNRNHPTPAETLVEGSPTVRSETVERKLWCTLRYTNSVNTTVKIDDSYIRNRTPEQYEIDNQRIIEAAWAIIDELIERGEEV